MTGTVKGNFGHMKESGVLLLTKEDSDAKHKRNSILAGLSFASLFTLGIGSMFLEEEADKEKTIRNLGRRYPDLPYSKCIELEHKHVVQYKGRNYSERCPLTESQQKKIDDNWSKVVGDCRDPEENFDPYPYTAMAWGGGWE